MAKLSTDLRTALLHPRENLFLSSSIGSVTQSAAVQADGCGTFALYAAGTFNGTLRVEGYDGANWVPLPMKPINVASVLLVASATVVGTWVGINPGFTQTRVSMTVWVSGAATFSLVNSNAALGPFYTGMGAVNSIGTATGVAAAAVTLTLASPGTGLRHYITNLRIERFSTALLVSAATPLIVTTTNLPGSLAYSLPADAATMGTVATTVENWSGMGIASSAQATATTIVCPATTAVIWRVTAAYFVAP